MSMALKDAATWRDRRDGVDIHVVGHDLNEVAGKEVILGHKVLSVGTAVGGQRSSRSMLATGTACRTWGYWSI